MTLLEEAIARGDGTPVYEVERQGGGAHRHRLRVISIDFGDSDSLYLEVSEPGGCGCYRRIDLAVLVHLLLNQRAGEAESVEAREVCLGGHRHHLDDVAVTA